MTDLGRGVNPMAEWMPWPVAEDQRLVNTEDGRMRWIVIRIEHYGEPTINTPFMVGWTGLPTIEMRVRRIIQEET